MRNDTKDFWKSITKLYSRVPGRSLAPQPTTVPSPAVPLAPGVPVTPAPTVQQVGPLDMNTKMAMINEAGGQRRKLKMVYNGKPRIVHPYSFRGPGSGRPQGGQWKRLVFYGFDEFDNRMKSFLPERIETMEITDQPYVEHAGWVVEFGKK